MKSGGAAVSAVVGRKHIATADAIAKRVGEAASEKLNRKLAAAVFGAFGFAMVEIYVIRILGIVLNGSAGKVALEVFEFLLFAVVVVPDIFITGRTPLGVIDLDMVAGIVSSAPTDAVGSGDDGGGENVVGLLEAFGGGGQPASAVIRAGGDDEINAVADEAVLGVIGTGADFPTVAGSDIEVITEFFSFVSRGAGGVENAGPHLSVVFPAAQGAEDAVFAVDNIGMEFPNAPDGMIGADDFVAAEHAFAYLFGAEVGLDKFFRRPGQSLVFNIGHGVESRLKHIGFFGSSRLQSVGSAGSWPVFALFAEESGNGFVVVLFDGFADEVFFPFLA